MSGNAIASKLQRIKEIENSEIMSISSNSYSTLENSFDQDSNSSLDNSTCEEYDSSYQKNILNAPQLKTNQANSIKLTQSVLNFKLNDSSNYTNAINNKNRLNNFSFNKNNITNNNSINMTSNPSSYSLSSDRINAKGVGFIFPTSMNFQQ